MKGRRGNGRGATGRGGDGEGRGGGRNKWRCSRCIYRTTLWRLEKNNESFILYTHTPLPPIYLLSYLSAPPRITAAWPAPALSAPPLPTSSALSPAAALPPVIGIATLNAVEEEGTILTRTARLHTHSKCICSGNVALSMSQRCRHRRRHRQPNTPTSVVQMSPFRSFRFPSSCIGFYPI